MLWYKELGFYSNPFSIKPAAFRARVVGYDLLEIYEKVESGSVIFVEGRYGYGKTTILKSIISRFRGKKGIVYYNCNRPDANLDVEGLLKGMYGLAGRVFNMMPKGAILLLDEVDLLSADDQKELQKFYKQGAIQTLVLFGASFEKANLGPELKKSLVDNVIQLTSLSDAEAVELVRERVGSIRLLTDEIITMVYRASDHNPRLFLENMEDLCRQAIENSVDVVSEEMVREMFSLPKATVATAAPKKKAASKKRRQRRGAATKSETPKGAAKSEESKSSPAVNESAKEPEQDEGEQAQDSSDDEEEAEYFY